MASMHTNKFSTTDQRSSSPTSVNFGIARSPSTWLCVLPRTRVSCPGPAPVTGLGSVSLKINTQHTHSTDSKTDSVVTRECRDT